MESIIWLYVLIALIVIVLLYYIKSLAQVQVWIRKRPRPGTLLNTMGYLEMDNDGSAGEVHLPGCGSLPSVGRVIVEKRVGRELGFVEVSTTDIEDETVTPKYKQVGFIAFNPDDVVDQYGYIYRQERGKRKKELVGYCARPSAPNTPTLYGERTWRSLWLRCTLNVYAGKPTPEEDEQSPKETNKSAKVERLYIASDRDEALESEAVDQTVEPSVVVEDVPVVEDDTIMDVLAESDDEALVDNSNEEISAAPEVVELEPEDEELVEDKPVSTPVVQEEKLVEESPVAAPIVQDEDEKNEKTEKKKKIKKEPIASVSYVGFHLSKNDYLPAEARACAFAALSSNFNRGHYAEFFKAQPYGWKDTALLSSVVYAIIFFTLYFVYECVLKRPILDDDFIAFTVLMVAYFPIWALVRLIKIDCIESSNSFQKRLDLFNKNLGLKGFNIAILVLGLIGCLVSILEADFIFLPLMWAIMLGVFVNMMLKGANTKWHISTSFSESDVDDEDEEEVVNPSGDIMRTYEWELDRTYSTQQLRGNLTLYFTACEIADMRQCNPFFAQRKDKSDKEYIQDMFQFLIEHRNFLARIRYIAKYINDIIKKNSLTPIDKIQFTLDFVQEPNIGFVANRESRVINNYEHYIRYPDETLYDKEGDSNSKSLLAAVLFYTMGHNVMYLASRKHNHSAIGIEINERDVANGWYGSNAEEMIVSENGKSYIYCETTGDRFKIGKSIGGMSIGDFDEKVLLEAESALPVEAVQEKSVIFNWDLNSALGNNLHGNLTLKFGDDYIDRLREMNPFMTYGYDSNTYEHNIRTMIELLDDEAELTQNVSVIAQYIKQRIASASLSELELVQFVLNFVQTPNISYRLDEECENIGFKLEYMRFPDETLCDKEGDCDCKSFLTATILHQLGYNVVYLLSSELKHAAIAVECKAEWLDVVGEDCKGLMTYNDKQYIYCESTGSGNRVGDIREGDSISDFATIIEYPA